MATILRDWSYRYPWFYDAVAGVAALAVGGDRRFRELAVQGLTIKPADRVLDLCCGNGQATRYLVNHSQHVTGLDASPFAAQRARENVPQASFVEGWAEEMPFTEASFDLVHTSVALHEMEPEQLEKILREVYRVLKPGGVFAFVDFHAPTNPIFWPGLATFCWLFETETAWQFLRTELLQKLTEAGFEHSDRTLKVGGSLQIVHAYKSGGE
jgi:demethylmenaquinone methyltransferase/2-methoxy-6-polyprenyl-1,4-benzoquinol methylase